MSGWLAIYYDHSHAFDESVLDAFLVRRSTLGDRVDGARSPGMVMAAWRRGGGEFSESGMIHRASGKPAVAWVGQCLGDDGDATPRAIEVVRDASASDHALSSLNGPFAAAVAHEADRMMTISLGRQAHYPVYIWRGEGVVVASTDMSAILPWMPSRRINTTALDLLLRLGELIDRMTLVQGIDMLPGGVRVRIDNAGVREESYWRFRHQPDGAIEYNTTARQLATRLTAAVRRVQLANERVGVPLSGGLDSRLLLGLCDNRHTVPSYTWGEPGCRDIVYAEKAAHRLGSPHTTKHWNLGEYARHWTEGVALTSGAFGVRDMYVTPYMDMISEDCDVVLNGLAGDVFLGGNFLRRQWLNEDNLHQLASHAWRWRVPEEDDRIADRLLREHDGDGVSRDLWVGSISRVPSGRPIERLVDWLIENRIFRYTNCGTMLLRHGVESHSPFFDNEFCDTLLRTPIEWRYKHRLYLRVMRLACPQATKDPWQRTALPISWGYHVALGSLAFHKATRAVARRAGIDPFPHQAVGDPAGWFRDQLRTMIDDIIMDDRCLSRGLYHPDELRGVWLAHQNGRDHSRMIGIIVMVELFCRLYLDSDSDAGVEPLV